jgi:outer membrane protein assembly factor BamD (BamD/ComL family)
VALMRGGGLVFLVATSLSGHAPYQCGKATDRSVREETPGEALYALAQKLKAEGDEHGYKTTLRYLVTRYPSSRFATAAQVDLGADGLDGGLK